ncbi:MAG: nitroreductase [Propionibacteriaceae bacterium]|jgi:nitroreductase|nr:nitroreductase [Propionibacteriaceae bacterium]
MNPVLDAIAARYSCRSYTAEPVARADLEAIARAGVQAPSSRGNEPWHVAVVTDPDLIADISMTALNLIARHEKAVAEDCEKRVRNLFYNAPALIIVATKNTHDYTSSDLDAGLLVENMCLAATSLGLGSCVCGFATQAFRDNKSDAGERLSRKLDFPWGYEMTIAVIIGHPDGTGAQHPTDLSSIHFFEA